MADACFFGVRAGPSSSGRRAGGWASSRSARPDEPPRRRRRRTSAAPRWRSPAAAPAACCPSLAACVSSLLGQPQAVDAVDQLTSGRSGLTLFRWRWPIMCQRSFSGDPAVRRARRAAAMEFVHLRRPLREHLHAALAQVGDAQLQDLADLLRGGGLVTAISVTSLTSRLALARLAMRSFTSSNFSASAIVWPRRIFPVSEIFRFIVRGDYREMQRTSNDEAIRSKRSRDRVDLGL